MRRMCGRCPVAERREAQEIARRCAHARTARRRQRGAGRRHDGAALGRVSGRSENGGAAAEAGADVKAANRYGVTPLSLACTNGDGAMVKLLLEAGADANTALPGGETALMTAARTGKVRRCGAAIARRQGEREGERDGQTALMWAAAEGNTEVVEALLEGGRGLPHALGLRIHGAAVRGARGTHRRGRGLLLKAGADPNETIAESSRAAARRRSRSATGTSALLLAVENAHFEFAVDAAGCRRGSQRRRNRLDGAACDRDGAQARSRR